MSTDDIEFATIEDWGRISGMRRTATYHALARGDLKAIKAGARVLVDVPAGLRWMRSLPAADIRLAALAAKRAA